MLSLRRPSYAIVCAESVEFAAFYMPQSLEFEHFELFELENLELDEPSLYSLTDAAPLSESSRFSENHSLLRAQRD